MTMLTPATRFTTPSDGWTGTLEEYFHAVGGPAHLRVEQIAAELGLRTSDQDGLVLADECEVLNCDAETKGGSAAAAESTLYALTGDPFAHLA